MLACRASQHTANHPTDVVARDVGHGAVTIGVTSFPNWPVRLTGAHLILSGFGAASEIPSSRLRSRSWNTLNCATESGEDLQLDGKF